MKTLAALAILLLCSPAGALEADNLLLVVNRNVPQGRELAEHYAKKRAVPDGRIVELDLPAGDEIPFSTYESHVVPPLREFITARKLEQKVSCMVLFYGVPLRIGARTVTAPEQQEAAALKEELQKLTERVVPAVENLEKLARTAQPAYVALVRGKSIEAYTQRADFAARFLSRHLAQMEDPPARDALMAEVTRLVDELVGPVVVATRRIQEAEGSGRLTDTQREQIAKAKAQLAELYRQVQTLQTLRNDPDARAKLRQLYRNRFGPLDLGRLLEGMADFLSAANTEAAVDSELACLGWGFYSRSNWLANPMQYRNQRMGMSQIVMTMRLDGPTPQAVRTLIDESIRVEAQGLAGTVVVDSGGHLAIDPKNPAYGAYDGTLRRFAEIVRTRTRLELVHDQKREVLPAGSVKNVALYTGWYAVRRYVPSCAFAPGAVAYHTASFEMCSLHNGGETGWCRGLLSDGVVATLGSVTEPYLSAFPPPDEFFPLLMTGRLTLAEVYWRTTTCVSWRMAMVGDPLYNPFVARPALAVDDLPDPLKTLFAATTHPVSRPVRNDASRP